MLYLKEKRIQNVQEALTSTKALQALHPRDGIHLEERINNATMLGIKL